MKTRKREVSTRKQSTSLRECLYGKGLKESKNGDSTGSRKNLPPKTRDWRTESSMEPRPEYRQWTTEGIKDLRPESRENQRK